MGIKMRRICCVLLALWLLMAALPVYAGQMDGYHDPAENWLTAGNRTSELDANAVVTKETFTCYYCGKQTQFTVWRTPEYTKDGRSALSRNIMFSDGTMVGGKYTGTIMDGTPGVDAYYTGYHWSKAVCEKCHTMNSHGEFSNYEFNKNVYMLYDCATEFIEELPEEVSFAYADQKYHTKTITGGTYCCFCYGTHKKEQSRLERHDIAETVTPELAHQRFVEERNCTLCDYAVRDYVAAKAVVADYYGVVDGEPHTVTVSDLSESGVKTQIGYGNSADSCTLTTAPNYTEDGQYTVYYEITYTYKNVDMTENGVANVWLRDETEDANCPCGCGDTNCDCQNNCGGNCCGSVCADDHHFILLDSIKAGCRTLGYDRYLCTNCGSMEKRDYVNATDHAWQKIVIREATCEQEGKKLAICQNCGEVKEENTDKGEHCYFTYSVVPTCTGVGYTARECANCGDRHIEDISPALAHSYKSYITPATCDSGGSTLHLCEGCGSSFVTDYTGSLGHSWDAGRIVTNATCTGEGVLEYHCIRCDYHKLEGNMANGHIPGAAASCTEDQTCTACGVILATATGHIEGDWIIDREPTVKQDGNRHKECTICGVTLVSEAVDKLVREDITDIKGEASIGEYIVIVTDTNSGRKIFNAHIWLDKNKVLQVEIPKGRLLDYDRQITVTVKLKKDETAVRNLWINVVDRQGNTAEAKTNRRGAVTVPTEPTIEHSYHAAYVIGYPDGSFRPEGSVTRGEAATIFARLLADEKDESIWGRYKFKDVGAEWYADYINYLAGYGIAVGRGIMEYAPNEAITRAEFVAMAVRFFEVYGDSNLLSRNNTTSFTDIKPGYWGAEYISCATREGWIVGYADGSFRPDESIGRAEMVSLMNRLLVRSADEEYVLDNLRKIHRFWDVDSRHWAYEDILEASNSHKAEISREGENWAK